LLSPSIQSRAESGGKSLETYKTSEVVCQFSWGEVQLSLSAETGRLAARTQSVREQMIEHGVFGSASAL
jgi:hypothetical protein